MKRSSMVLTAALIALLTACSSDSAEDGVASLETTQAVADTAQSSSESTTEASESEVDAEEAMLEFAACMRENGIEMNDPSVDADGNVRFGSLRSLVEGEVDQDDLETARDSCIDLLEGVGLTFGDRKNRAVEQDAFLAFAICMRDNGYDMQDPDFSQTGPGGGGQGPFGPLDIDDPDFKAAMVPCREHLAGTGPDGAGPPWLGG